MRKLFTTEEAMSRGIAQGVLRWGEGRYWCRIVRGVYGVGPEPPSPLDRARAEVIRTQRVAGGHLAGVLYELDGVSLRRQPVARRPFPADRVAVVAGTPCVDGLQTMIDLAATLTDDVWEQALESALRKQLTTIAELEAALPALRAGRVYGSPRMRRVLAARPPGAPPTGSLLETLAIQLARGVPVLRDPVRQLVVHDRYGAFVARVDIAWPHAGFFFELDGQQHKGQPVYDARRETAVVAATGWLPGRFTWTEIVYLPTSTRRRMDDIARQALRRRPHATTAGFAS